ncbi:MAG: type II secretion system protein GspC [Gammaproteobacteria bacterium]|nr:type II secretion system protein GspC [Gammaproteobacteria bacterium]
MQLPLFALQWGALAQRLVPWCNLLLVLLLAYTMAGIGWRIWPQLPHTTVLPLPVASPTTTTTPGLSALAALHLFGEVEVAATAPPTPVIDAPETRLSLTLRGIVAVSDGGVGRALIAEGTQEDRLYKVGDALIGGAVLHEVLTDKVILKRGERLETLTLPRERVGVADGVPAIAANAQGGAGGALSQQLRTLRQSVINDPQLAFSLVKMQPVMEGGAIKGYRVTPGKERKLFHDAGLRAGDVVTRVNGVALSDTSQLAALYSQFQSASRFDLVVQRGGRTTSLTIDLEK